MSIQTDIKEKIKDAMKAKDTVSLLVYRNILSSVTNELVASGRTPQDVATDEEVLIVIKRLSKQRKDSILQFDRGGRKDLADNERAELLILETFLPKMMTADEIRPIALAKKEALDVADKSGLGKLVGSLMSELKGKADGGDVKMVVESLFNN